MAKRRALMQGEARIDFLGREAIISPERSQRPHDFISKMRKKKTKPKDCFFCPGNEHLTPPEICRIPNGKSGWQCRCFANKFPALAPNWRKAYGFHEVIVETPSHFKTLSQLGGKQLFGYLKMVQSRLETHSKNRKIKFASVFKNEGEDAGASLEHTHTQLVFMPFVPNYAKQQANACKGRCHFCKLKKDKKYPKIFSNKEFSLLCPFVPKYKYEAWIVPKKHVGSLLEMDDAQIASLAKILAIALRAQDKCLNYPPYNILFHMAPFGERNFHMHISLTPRLANWAGLEHQSGVILNSTLPEFAARHYLAKLGLIK